MSEDQLGCFTTSRFPYWADQDTFHAFNQFIISMFGNVSKRPTRLSSKTTIFVSNPINSTMW